MIKAEKNLKTMIENEKYHIVEGVIENFKEPQKSPLSTLLPDCEIFKTAREKIHLLQIK